MSDITLESCPGLVKIKLRDQRLIDTGQLHHEASLAGNSERYRRGETSHTIHVWWARRPHVAMRSLTYATVCKSLSNTNVDLMKKLSNSYSDDKFILEARKEVKKGYKTTPKILDMFGGGGTIPYEALNLGLDVYSIDSNELSVFIQKSNLQYPNEVKVDNLPRILKKSGENILKDLEELTNDVFPLRRRKDGKQTINYLWTYAIPCENCKNEFSLCKRYWLSKKNDKNLFIKVDESKDGPEFSVCKADLFLPRSNWVGRLNKVICPHCQHEMNGLSIKRAKDIIAVEIVKEKTGKTFYPATQLSDELSKKIVKLEKRLLRDLKSELPKSKLPKWSGIVNPALYGIETHADIFNPRQRVVCLSLLKALKDEYHKISKKEGTATARHVISILSGLVDQVVDWNCRMAMWISQNEQVGRAFCGPGISMYWDYNETDPVLDGPSNLKSKLNRIIKGVESIKRLPKGVNVTHATAQNLPFPDKNFDAIVTDPPYYDNIFYTVLADNFYAWKRVLLKHIVPGLFENISTTFNHELVASSNRSGGGDKSHEEYCQNLNKAINEASRVLKDDGVMSFIYSHSSIRGWEAIIRAFRYSPMVITSVQPLSIERKQRPRAMKSEAINTCITFVARKATKKKKALTIKKLENKFLEILDGDFPTSLRDVGWCDEDIAIGLMANGVAMISNADYINKTDDSSALICIENMIKQKFPKFNLTKRNSI